MCPSFSLSNIEGTIVDESQIRHDAAFDLMYLGQTHDHLCVRSVVLSKFQHHRQTTRRNRKLIPTNSLPVINIKKKDPPMLLLIQSDTEMSRWEWTGFPQNTNWRTFWSFNNKQMSATTARPIQSPLMQQHNINAASSAFKVAASRPLPILPVDSSVDSLKQKFDERLVKLNDFKYVSQYIQDAVELLHQMEAAKMPEDYIADARKIIVRIAERKEKAGGLPHPDKPIVTYDQQRKMTSSPTPAIVRAPSPVSLPRVSPKTTPSPKTSPEKRATPVRREGTPDSRKSPMSIMVPLSQAVGRPSPSNPGRLSPSRKENPAEIIVNRTERSEHRELIKVEYLGPLLHQWTGKDSILVVQCPAAKLMSTVTKDLPNPQLKSAHLVSEWHLQRESGNLFTLIGSVDPEDPTKIIKLETPIEYPAIASLKNLPLVRAEIPHNVPGVQQKLVSAKYEYSTLFFWDDLVVDFSQRPFTKENTIQLIKTFTGDHPILYVPSYHKRETSDRPKTLELLRPYATALEYLIFRAETEQRIDSDTMVKKGSSTTTVDKLLRGKGGMMVSSVPNETERLDVVMSDDEKSESKKRKRVSDEVSSDEEPSKKKQKTSE